MKLCTFVDINHLTTEYRVDHDEIEASSLDMALCVVHMYLVGKSYIERSW
jgi:hypothetical protein